MAEDPTFADAQSSLANLYMYTNRASEMTGPLQAAMDHLYRLPERSRFVVKSNYYVLVRQDTDKAMAALAMWAELFPDDIQAYQAQLTIQAVRDDKDGALESLKTILGLGGSPRVRGGVSREPPGPFPARRTGSAPGQAGGGPWLLRQSPPPCPVRCGDDGGDGNPGNS